MNRRLKHAIFFALCGAYLWNATLIVISSLSSTPRPRLQPQLPMNGISQEEQSKYNDIVSSHADIPRYTEEMASQAIRSAPWTCGDPDDSAVDPITNQKPMFAFVHIYKTAGSSVRFFFQAYSHICRKAWMCLIGCTQVKPYSIVSTPGEGEGVRDWDKCRVKNVMDRHHVVESMGMDDRLYPTVNNTILRKSFDIYGGHFRIGTGDNILKNNSNIHAVRHIVFLRDPMERFVSGILYERKNDVNQSLTGTVDLIKKRIRGSRAADDYWDKSLTYLLTPKQSEEFQKMKPAFMKAETTKKISPREYFAEIKARATIHNLHKYNVIVGMTERMNESMDVLKDVLLANRNEEHQTLLEQHANVTRNESNKGKISTASVMEALKIDKEFMSVFEEYVKFEKIIHDYAMSMHLMQHGLFVKQTGSSSVD
ncbi:hypothetical protein HJC23_007176 [Cyclotella cryptica]|uniref:Sulfotransferase domain-containing protein n=1 Tax=Cyclotella cryptica TaxID=29204 RepID=A0ABD3QQX7_9STRA|eukprot:CCRYP_003443-RA/>CCRYP_003443-RA protein AED:0.04 eAED:0.04 QI:328/1/1/1/0/0/3/682/424